VPRRRKDRLHRAIHGESRADCGARQPAGAVEIGAGELRASRHYLRGFPGRRSGAAFDRILVDAPCSNTGVLRRRVDLRWRIRPEEIERLRERSEVVGTSGPAIEGRRTLVYSTCSLEPEENESVTSEFLQGHADFKLESQRQLLPFVEGVDGAYVARMRKAVDS